MILYWFACLMISRIPSLSFPWRSVTSATLAYCNHHLLLPGCPSKNGATRTEQSGIKPAECQNFLPTIWPLPFLQDHSLITNGPQNPVFNSVSVSHSCYLFICSVFYSSVYRLLEGSSYHRVWHVAIIPQMFFKTNFWNGESPSVYIRRSVWIHSLKISR